MNKYWKYVLFPNFLDSIKDCSYSNLDNSDLIEVLTNITKSSIEDFLFPKIALDYNKDTTIDPLDGLCYGYYFIDETIGEPEYKVILAFMRVRWIEQQIAWDSNFKNPFFDKDIKGYSPSAMLVSMNTTLQTAISIAEDIRKNYGRVGTKGKKTKWGEING